MKRWFKFIVMVAVLALVGATFTSTLSQDTATADLPANGTFGENYDPDPELLLKAFGTTENVPEIALAAFARAAQTVDEATLAKALECWKANCDTGSGGELTVALADGFGDNVWREISHMELILQALTYPEIGKLVYTNAHYDTQTAISDLNSLVAQGVDIIISYPDGGEALLPAVREATDAGIIYVPYSYGKIGEPGTDYLTSVAEDVCQLGKNFAGILNDEVGTGKVAFLGGTPGNPLSAYWQSCEEPELGSGLTLIGKADTNWTREGVLAAVSGFLSSDPDLAGISYEYADGFLGGLRAYEAANLPVNLVLTLRTDEMGLFCEWKTMANPDFKIYYSAGGNAQIRIALTAAMMKRAGAEIPPEIIVPSRMRQVDDSSCNPDVPGETPVSSLLPADIIKAMYPPSS